MTNAEFVFGAIDYIEALATKYEAGTVFHATAAETINLDGEPAVNVTFYQDGVNMKDEAVATVWLEDGNFYGEW